MAKRWVQIGLGVLAATLMAGHAPVWAGPGVTCSTQSTTNDCGGTAGDALCLDGSNQPDPLQDCVDLGDGTCGCRPRICCDCDDVGNDEISACNLPCTQTGIGLLVCVGLCAVINDGANEECNLSIVNRSGCTGDTCPTTGCCTFLESSMARTVSSAVCLETNADTCTAIGMFGGATFIAGGSCEGGLSGTCTAPTPTATATATGTATSTATATQTATVSNTPTRTNTATQTRTASSTPTNTLVPDGGACVTPSQCSSMFCVDGVCCDTICDEPFESCNQPGMQGICSPVVAPAPALSNLSLLLAMLSLAVVGVLALMWRRSQS